MNYARCGDRNSTATTLRHGVYTNAARSHTTAPPRPGPRELLVARFLGRCEARTGRIRYYAQPDLRQARYLPRSPADPMSFHYPRMARRPAAAVWLGLWLASAAACGGSKTDKNDSGTTGKLKCISPGIGGQCMCGSGRSGTNMCGEDKFWTPCVCVSLPDGALCFDGQQLRCTVNCPGESSGRIVRCVDGQYDCSCADAGPDTRPKLDAGL
jgi:hypothetical protein